MDVQVIQQWLLHFGSTSQELWHAVAKLIGWMANNFPPWATY
jgi:hypothetical protein